MPVLVCLRGSCSHVTEVGCLKVCETGAEGCHVKWWGLCGRNSAITRRPYLRLNVVGKINAENISMLE